jgi:hypothetical protein
MSTGIGAMATTGWPDINKQVAMLHPIRPKPTTPTGISVASIIDFLSRFFPPPS